MAIDDGSNSKILTHTELQVIFNSAGKVMPQIHMGEVSNAPDMSSDDDSSEHDSDEEMICELTAPPKAMKMVKMVKLPLEPGTENLLLQVTKQTMAKIAIKNPGIAGTDLLWRTNKKLLRMPLLDQKLNTFYAPDEFATDETSSDSSDDDDDEENDKIVKVLIHSGSDEDTEGDDRDENMQNDTDNINESENDTPDDEQLMDEVYYGDRDGEVPLLKGEEDKKQKEEDKKKNDDDMKNKEDDIKKKQEELGLTEEQARVAADIDDQLNELVRMDEEIDETGESQEEKDDEHEDHNAHAFFDMESDSDDEDVEFNSDAESPFDSDSIYHGWRSFVRYFKRMEKILKDE